MINKNDVINELIKEHGYTSYLELGYANGDGFKTIDCKKKYSVDVNGKADFTGTTDDFFNQLPKIKRYDIILIDALHHADQVRKDIINASKHLTKNGAIVLHDVNPAKKEFQEVPCKTHIWTGDCWRAFHGFKKKYPNIQTVFYPFDHGVGVIFPHGKVFEGVFEDLETTFEEYRKYVDCL